MAAALPGSLASCAGDKPSSELVVGGLPVTCNLTLPVACVARAKAAPAAGGQGPVFEFSKYSGWPEIKESLMAGRIQAAYMLAPLVMDLADKKIPVKIERRAPLRRGHHGAHHSRIRSAAFGCQAHASKAASRGLRCCQDAAAEGHDPADIEIVEMPHRQCLPRCMRMPSTCVLHRRSLSARASSSRIARPLRRTRDGCATTSVRAHGG